MSIMCKGVIINRQIFQCESIGVCKFSIFIIILVIMWKVWIKITHNYPNSSIVFSWKYSLDQIICRYVSNVLICLYSWNIIAILALDFVIKCTWVLLLLISIFKIILIVFKLLFIWWVLRFGKKFSNLLFFGYNYRINWSTRR